MYFSNHQISELIFTPKSLSSNQSCI